MKAPEDQQRIRIEYKEVVSFWDKDVLIIRKRGGGETKIPSNKWFINTRTPVGEDAELYLRKPYGDKKQIEFSSVIAVERLVEDYNRTRHLDRLTKTILS